MKDTEVAGRYARALFAAASAAKKDKAVREDLHAFMRAWRADPGLSKILEHPLKPAADKEKAIRKVLPGDSPGLVQRFIQLLLARKRLPLLPYIALWFDDAFDRANGIRKVQVRSAEPLTKEQIANLQKQLGKSWGGEVAVEASVDKGLIGGMVITSGDRVWDRSARGQLARLQQNLLQTAQN